MRCTLGTQVHRICCLGEATSPRKPSVRPEGGGRADSARSKGRRGGGGRRHAAAVQPTDGDVGWERHRMRAHGMCPPRERPRPGSANSIAAFHRRTNGERLLRAATSASGKAAKVNATSAEGQPPLSCRTINPPFGGRTKLDRSARQRSRTTGRATSAVHRTTHLAHPVSQPGVSPSRDMGPAGLPSTGRGGRQLPSEGVFTFVSDPKPEPGALQNVASRRHTQQQSLSSDCADLARCEHYHFRW